MWSKRDMYKIYDSETHRCFLNINIVYGVMQCSFIAVLQCSLNVVLTHLRHVQVLVCIVCVRQRSNSAAFWQIYFHVPGPGACVHRRRLKGTKPTRWKAPVTQSSRSSSSSTLTATTVPSNASSSPKVSSLKSSTRGQFETRALWLLLLLLTSIDFLYLLFFLQRPFQVWQSGGDCSAETGRSGKTLWCKRDCGGKDSRHTHALTHTPRRTLDQTVNCVT